MKKKEVKLFHHAFPSFPNHPPNLKFQGKKWSLTITQLMSRIHVLQQESIQWNNLQHRINLWFKSPSLNVEIIHLNNKAKNASYGPIKFRPLLTSLCAQQSNQLTLVLAWCSHPTHSILVLKFFLDFSNKKASTFLMFMPHPNGMFSSVDNSPSLTHFI